MSTTKENLKQEINNWFEKTLWPVISKEIDKEIDLRLIARLESPERSSKNLFDSIAKLNERIENLQKSLEPDRIFLLYGGQSADGRGYSEYKSFTKEPLKAYQFYMENINQNPYSTGNVVLIDQQGFSNHLSLDNLKQPAGIK